MQIFWDGFEKRSKVQPMEKNAWFPGVETLLGAGKALGRLGGEAAATHAVPNIASLAMLRNKTYAKNLGQHFSEGLFNIPMTRAKAFKQGLPGGVIPEHALMANEFRDFGNQLREHLKSNVIDFGGEKGFDVIKNIMSGNVQKARSIDPHMVDSVMEFAKQNKINPISIAVRGKELFKDPSHPILHNILPNMLQMPKRVKGSVKPNLGSHAAEEAALDATANRSHPIKRFFTKEPPLGDMPENFSSKKVKLPPADDSGKVNWKDPGKTVGLKVPSAKRLDARAGSRKGPTMSEEQIDEAAKKHFGLGARVPAALKPKEMESYIPDFAQAISERVPQHEKYRALGVGAGALGAGGATAAAFGPASGLMTGGMNFGKYMHFSSPKWREFLKKRSPSVKGWDYGRAEHAATTGLTENAFRKGLVEDKPLNPYTNFLHRTMYSGLSGEMARSANAMGRVGASAIPPEHRKGVFENIVGRFRGEPGSMMAAPTREAPSVMEHLKPLAVPLGVGAAAGATGYAAARMKGGKPQQGPSDNVRPLIRAPRIVPELPQQQMMGA